ncbi:hypothetical protein D3C71_1139840 [compost metagenome]
MFAGNGGYHVDAGHVNLIGGAIASTNAANSELTAQTLTFSDLQNQMDYSASSGSISGGAGGQMKGWDPKAGTTAPRGGPGTPMTESGSDSSSTLATLTEGNITIGGKQTTAAELGINTDAGAAHRALEALPDASKLLADQQAMAGAMGTVVSTGQRIRADMDAAIDVMKQQKEDAKSILANPELSSRLSAEEKAVLVMTVVQSENEIQRLQKAGVLVSAISGGLAGTTGSVGNIAAGTLAPVLSYQIGQYFKENAVRNMQDGGSRGEEGGATHLLAHALLGAAVASAGDRNALIGAIAAGGAEAIAPAVSKLMYGKDSKDLTAPEKDVVSAIVGAGGAIIGSFKGGLAGSATGTDAAKNALENNWEEVGHYSTMAVVLYLGGLNEQDARALALAAWGPDTDSRNAITDENVRGGLKPDMPQQYNHLLDGLSDPEKVKSAQSYWTAKVGEIVADIKRNENNPEEKKRILQDPETQRALHAMGDSFAHVMPDKSHFNPVYGHLIGSLTGNDPDNPNTHPEAYVNYSLAIYEAATGSYKSTSLRDSSYVQDLARRVTLEPEPERQKAILDTAAAFFTTSRKSGLVHAPIGDCGLLCQWIPATKRINSRLGDIYNEGLPQGPFAPVIDWSRFNQLGR